MYAHEVIDEEFKEEKIKTRRIYKTFALVDFIFMLFMLVLFSHLMYAFFYLGYQQRSNWAIELPVAVIDVIIGITLGFSAFCLAKTLKKLTRIDQNNCIVYFHVINLFIYVVTLTVQLVFT